MAMASSYMIFALAGGLLLALLLLERSMARALTWTFTALTALALALALSVGTLAFDTHYALHDVWVTLDVMSVAQAGLIPSVDFPSPIGAFYFMVYDWALALAPLGFRAMMTANVITALIGVVLTLAMLGRRVSAPVLAGTFLLVVATAISTREIDSVFPRTIMSAMAPYNRWGWALLAPVALLFCAPSAARRDDLGAAAAGIGIALLLMLKVTYGGIGLCLLAGAALVRPGGARDAAVAALAAAAAMGLFVAAGHPIGPYLADLADISAVSGVSERLIQVVRVFGEALVWLLAALTLLCMLAPRPDGGALRAWLATLMVPAILLAGCVLGGMLILMQNHYNTEASLYPVAIFAAYEWGRRLAARAQERPDAWHDGRVWRAHAAGGPPLNAAGANPAILFAAMLLALRFAVVDVGVTAAQVAAPAIWPPEPALRGGVLEGLRMAPDFSPKTGLDGAIICTSASCRTLAEAIDGQEMLQAQGVRDETVLALAFGNPFPVLLGAPRPPHAPIWFHQGRSFSDVVHPAPNRLFTGVDVVMALRKGQGAALSRIYAPILARDFQEVARSNDWIMLRRHQAEPAAASAAGG